MNRYHLLLYSALLFSFSACKPGKQEVAQTPVIAFSVARIFPHDKTAFTQGLTIADGRLFESTGQGGSWIAEVDIASGRQDKKVVLDKKYFGEGIAILNNKIYQLTWQNHIGFVYDEKTFQKKGEFTYAHEGWGITHDGKSLIVSDGTNKLHFLDTVTLKEKSVIAVHDAFGPVDNLNELEYIENYIFANKWQTNTIYKIDPANGEVAGKMELEILTEKMRDANPGSDVLNGIAYEEKSKVLLVTGKLWPNLFALKIKEKK